MCGTPVKGSMSSRPYHGLPRAADMVACFGRNCKGRCRVHWRRPSRSPTCTPWEIPLCQPTCRQRGGKMMAPVHLGKIAPTSETRGEKTGRISGMDPIKWRQLSKNQRMPAAASVQELIKARELIKVQEQRPSSSGGRVRGSGRREASTRSHGTTKEGGRTGRSTHLKRCLTNPALTTPCFPINQQITPPGNARGQGAWQGVKEHYPLRHPEPRHSPARILCLCLLGSSK